MKDLKVYKLSVSFLIIFAFSQNSLSQLSGSYTIGTGGNYPTITSAVNALNLSGISQDVIFNIKTGSYTESVTINSISGASANHTVTFKSQSGNADDVSLIPSSSSNYTLKINGASYLRIQNVSFQGSSSSNDKSRIYFQGNNNDVKISDNNFLGGRSKDNGLFSSDALMGNLVIERNRFEVKNGIIFKELNLISTGTKISDNIVNCVYGIVIYRHNNLLIEKNNFNCSSVTGGFPSPACIRAMSCNGNLKILANKLIATSVTEAEDGIVVGYYSGNNALIANNFISLNTGTGMWFDASHNLNIYFNTVLTSSVNSGDITFVECYGENKSRNNLMINLANEGTRSLTYYIYQSVVPNSDYNLFLYHNPIMAFLTPHYITNLAELRAVAGCDLHSIEWNVNFVSGTDFHLAGSSIGDPNLKGIPINEITTDIDGQPRSASRPYMGADEADIPLTVISSSSNIPETFSLSQNYPNPFNPVTNITYQLPLSGNVVLKIFNALGKEVETLVDTRQEAGNYSVNFNASNFSSGIYFYKLNVDNFVDTKKMSLIK